MVSRLIQESVPAESAGKQKSPWRRLFMGTWSHTDDETKKAPKDMPKREFGELLWQLAEQVFQKARESGKRSRLNHMSKVSVWVELHQNGYPHYHFPCLAEDLWSYVPLARALRERGICVDFKAEHDFYWSAIVYLAVPSALPGGKQETDLDPAPWLSPNHALIREVLEDIPRGARACEKGRVRRYLGLAGSGGKTGRDIAFTDKEFAAHVVAHGLRDPIALMAWVQERVRQKDQCDKNAYLTAVGLEAFMYKHQQDLSARLTFAWRMNDASAIQAAAQASAWDVLKAAASSAQCICSGQWAPMTEELLQYHCRNFPHTHPQDELPSSAAVSSKPLSLNT
eukprot:5079268-Karenia_brevis.AAC.2